MIDSANITISLKEMTVEENVLEHHVAVIKLLESVICVTTVSCI